MDEQVTGGTGQGVTNLSGGQPDERIPLRLWLGLMALALSAMMHGVDSMVVTVASPTISRDMHTGLSQLLWLTTGYLLSYAATLVPAGKLGDRYGHRRVFLAGIVGFAISSVLVGVSKNIGMLIAWRVVQGACGGCLIPSALAIVRLTFPASKLKVAIGVFVGTFALSAAGGPFLGGVVVQYAGWRWIFFINVIAGAVTLALTLILIRPTPPSDPHRSLDLPGIGLIAVTLAALVLGISQASLDGWAGALPVTCFVVAVVCGLLLILRERATSEPLLPPSLFRSRTFDSGNLLLLFGSGVIFPVWLYLSFFLQNVQGATPVRTGIELLPIPAAGIIAAPLGGVLNQKLGARVPLVAGFVLTMVSFFGLSRLTPGSGYSSVWPFLVTLGMSMSFIVPVGLEAVVSSAAKHLAGVASGVGETMGSLGPALGVASVGTAITFVIRNGLAGRLAAAAVPAATGAQVRGSAQYIAQGIAPTPSGTPGGLAATITRLAHDAFTSGLHTILLASMIVLLVLLPLIWLIKPPVPGQEDETIPAQEAAR
jgi:EmrB/QacA subfamily drug resistance transporter